MPKNPSPCSPNLARRISNSPQWRPQRRRIAVQLHELGIDFFFSSFVNRLLIDRWALIFLRSRRFALVAQSPYVWTKRWWELSIDQCTVDWSIPPLFYLCNSPILRWSVRRYMRSPFHLVPNWLSGCFSFFVSGFMDGFRRFMGFKGKKWYSIIDVDVRTVWFMNHYYLLSLWTFNKNIELSL